MPWRTLVAPTFMTGRDIGVGLIGFGFASRTFHAPLIKATPGLAIAAIATRQESAALAAAPGVAIFHDPAAMIASDAIDVVVVATPHDSHAAWAIQALEAGKHVVVEKPFTLKLDDARRVAAVAERTGRLLSVFHNRRWASDFLSVRSALDDGLVGRVAHFEAHFDRFRPVIRDRWRETSSPAAGLWFDLGPHLLDHSLHLFGIPDDVSADLAALRPGATSDDWAHCVLRYPDHRVILHASILVAGESPRFIVHGDAGSLVKTLADRQEAQLLAGLAPGAAGWGIDPDPLRVWDKHGVERHVPAAEGNQGLFYAKLVSALTDGAPNPVPPPQAIAVVALVEAALTSSVERKAVTPALTQEERARFYESRGPLAGARGGR